MCEHEWKKTDTYIDSFLDGYGIDAVKVEERIDEFTCTKCGLIKEE